MAKAEDIKRSVAKLIDEKVNTEDLIYEVEKNSAIWNSTLEEYVNKVEKRNAWYKVITNFFPDFDEKPSTEKNEIGKLF